MSVQSVLFGLDDTLYDTTLQMSMARMSAIKAMIAEGLPVEAEFAYNILNEIVKKYGNHHPKHFDLLLETLGLKYDPKIIAAGVLAYREISSAYLKPYSDIIQTVLKLRDNNIKVYVVTSGPPVKQWQKLIALGLDHLFHGVFIEENPNTMQGFTSEFLHNIIQNLKIKETDAIFVSGVPEEISVATNMGLRTVYISRSLIGYKNKQLPQNVIIINSMRELLSIIKIP
jgi:putative hydrolase of the HAD superfamily